MKKKLPEDNVETPEPILLPVIDPITQEFGNGELNVLRDKINEIIANR